MEADWVMTLDTENQYHLNARMIINVKERQLLAVAMGYGQATRPNVQVNSKGTLQTI